MGNLEQKKRNKDYSFGSAVGSVLSLLRAVKTTPASKRPAEKYPEGRATLPVSTPQPLGTSGGSSGGIPAEEEAGKAGAGEWIHFSRHLARAAADRTEGTTGSAGPAGEADAGSVLPKERTSFCPTSGRGP